MKGRNKMVESTPHTIRADDDQWRFIRLMADAAGLPLGETMSKLSRSFRARLDQEEEKFKFGGINHAISHEMFMNLFDRDIERISEEKYVELMTELAKKSRGGKND
jgi:hypothetical protein